MEQEYLASHGDRLGYIAHRPRKGNGTALVYLHGISSHAGWFDEAGDRLCALGYTVYCLDRRGSGINRENRGFPSGYIESYEEVFADIHDFVVPLRRRFRHVYLIGLSWGGKLALAYALRHQNVCDGLVLITPGLVGKVDLTLLQKMKVLVETKTAPRGGIWIIAGCRGPKRWQILRVGNTPTSA